MDGWIFICWTENTFKKDIGIYCKGCQTSYLCDSRNGLGTKLTIKIDTTHEMINSLIESLFWSFIFVYFVYFHTSSFKWKFVWCKFVLWWFFQVVNNTHTFMLSTPIIPFFLLPSQEVYHALHEKIHASQQLSWLKTLIWAIETLCCQEIGLSSAFFTGTECVLLQDFPLFRVFSTVWTEQ